MYNKVKYNDSLYNSLTTGHTYVMDLVFGMNNIVMEELGREYAADVVVDFGTNKIGLEAVRDIKSDREVEFWTGKVSVDKSHNFLIEVDIDFTIKNITNDALVPIVVIRNATMGIEKINKDIERENLKVTNSIDMGVGTVNYSMVMYYDFPPFDLNIYYLIRPISIRFDERSLNHNIIIRPISHDIRDITQTIWGED